MNNTIGIFSEGLRRSEEPSDFQWATLEPGIYLADRVTKSFNYCGAVPPDNIGFILVVEAALGKSDVVQL